MSTPPARARTFLTSFMGSGNQAASARLAGISPTTARKLLKRCSPLIEEGERDVDALVAFGLGLDTLVPAVVPHHDDGGEDDKGPAPFDMGELTAVARRGLRDFGFFCRRYFGRVDTPWREEAAYKILELLDTEDKEYLVINCPPGVGKSTLMTHDIPIWLLCRDRSVRILVGSRTQGQAERLVGRIKRTLQARYLLQPSDRDLKRGLAVRAKGILVDDYGRFAPAERDVWNRGALMVEQHTGRVVTEKEPTVTAYGFDGDYLGSRPDLSVWDDLVDKKNTGAGAMESVIELYESQAESRIEPGGLHVLQGQRLAARDLYRWSLNLRRPEVEDDVAWLEGRETTLERGLRLLEADMAPPPGPEEAGEEGGTPDPRAGFKYHHVIFPAHIETACQGLHRPMDPAWGDPLRPGGCLLDPRRLTWRDLMAVRENSTERYRVTYQQEDLDPDSALIPEIWIRGGRGNDGVEYPGCWDTQRHLRELPRGLTPPLHSLITADPSPTRFWAVQWWAWHPATRQMFLLDSFKGRMEAPDLIDWSQQESRYTGLLEDWWLASAERGFPIRTLILEINVAQRFLGQYDHFKRWKRDRSVNYTPHSTGRNKSDDDKGVFALRPEYRHGRVHFPGADLPARSASHNLIDEAVVYDGADGTTTDDQIMAQWFLLWNAERLFPQRPETPPKGRVPSWLSPSRALAPQPSKPLPVAGYVRGR